MRKNDYAVVIHGGAGTILKAHLKKEDESNIRSDLKNIVIKVNKMLTDKQHAIDAVEFAVKELENNPFFNAGKGAVYTNQLTHELDASIMDGRDLSTGAVAGVRYTANPISLAKKVMQNSNHVLLSGQGAEQFARDQGFEEVDNCYFDTDLRLEQLKTAQKHNALSLETGGIDKKFGTVGAVALDSYGNLAAATSTGGITNKAYGRIGDSPIVGAGTYANNETCSVSATGHGEMFIRKVVAYDIHARIKYLNQSLEQACFSVVMEELPKINGSGGIIAIDRFGNISMTFNSKGMYRACAGSNTAAQEGIFDND